MTQEEIENMELNKKEKNRIYTDFKKQYNYEEDDEDNDYFDDQRMKKQIMMIKSQIQVDIPENYDPYKKMKEYLQSGGKMKEYQKQIKKYKKLNAEERRQLLEEQQSMGIQKYNKIVINKNNFNQKWSINKQKRYENWVLEYEGKQVGGFQEQFQIALFILLVMSVSGISDVWNCILEKDNHQNKQLCMAVRKKLNCKTVQGPLNGLISLHTDQNANATAEISCPWQSGISEIRICFILSSIVSIILAALALKKEDKEYSNMHTVSAMFLSVLMIISALFDYISIRNSLINNYNLCNLKEEFFVDEQTK
ncbi:hypothetical protein IMG5_034150, partial [Ichthyophthirius multifiliis]